MGSHFSKWLSQDPNSGLSDSKIWLLHHTIYGIFLIFFLLLHYKHHLKESFSPTLEQCLTIWMNLSALNTLALLFSTSHKPLIFSSIHCKQAHQKDLTVNRQSSNTCSQKLDNFLTFWSQLPVFLLLVYISLSFLN